MPAADPASPALAAPGSADDLALLVEAAREAGDVALGFFRQDPQVWHKENASPVSEADLAVDHLLKARLTGARPGYGWLSEETVDDPARLACARVFIVDPIDGTRGFLAGSDEWTISLALVDEGLPTAAVLLQPTTGRLFAALAGGGTTVDGVPLRAAAPASLDGARIAGPTALLTRLRRHRPAIRDAGYIASLALRIAMVATGEIDIAFARASAHDWDIAAADLILGEAGGRLALADGARIRYNRPATTHGALVAAGSAALAEEAIGNL